MINLPFKLSAGVTLIPSIYTLATMFISFGLLSLALEVIPIGTAYAVWTEIGQSFLTICSPFLVRNYASTGFFISA